MGLLFERFLSRERAEPPDIDLDIEHERREEVIQHVYEVYGRDHAAMVVQRHPLPAALGGARRRQGARHPGDRARSRREAAVDVRRPSSTKRSRAPGSIRSSAAALDHLARLSERDPRVPAPPRRSTPAASCSVTSRSHDIVPIENATMPGRTVIQWDKDDLEDLGLFKVDLLGLGALHQLHLVLRSAARRIAASSCRWRRSPPRTPATYDMICTRRHGRHVPDREPRADVDAAAAAAAHVLRPRRRGQHRAPGPDLRRHGASVPAPPQRARSRSSTRTRASSRCSRRRSACRCSRSR